MRTYPYALVVNGNMAANSPAGGVLASSAQKIDYTVGYSVQATYTGKFPQGTLVLDASNDGIGFAPIANSTVQLVDGSSGVTLWNYGRLAGYDYLRLRFLGTSASSGVLNATFYSKGA